ncbi:hypothetical protein O3P69_012351 [Scylla paramamosain]|uniref:Uncharacterized protein n=2 Tax=Scylla paramamosain TaxID=85552 RepID=A0AAW0SLJ7_SCYPA
MGNAVIQPCTSDPQAGGDTTFCAMRYSKSTESLPEEGKVVIRPIAFKPVASPGVQAISPPTNGGVVGGGSTASFVVHSSSGLPAAKPDPRYTSAPSLAKGVIHHYGSMGDLKTLSHNSYSLDRRGLTTPLSSRGHCDQHTGDNKYNSLTKLHNSKNTSLNNKNSYSNNISNNINNSNNCHNISSSSNGSSSSNSSSKSPPNCRPPSHQSTSSNIEDGHNHHKFAQDDRLSSHYESSLDNRLSNTYDNASVYTRINGYSNSDLPRYDSLKNLSSDSGHSFGHHLHNPPMVSSLHQRMGGSVTNLSRISNGHHTGSVQGLDRPGSSIRLDRSASVTGSNLDRSGSVSGSNLGLDRSLSVTGSNLGLDRTICGSVSGSLSELTLDEHHQTPSPSDSGVAELEAMLKEKDSEINTLRETMEQNEQVIFKVYEEKEKTWERELKKIRDLYDSRLKGAQQKALKMEQSLTTQTYQLQQERRKLVAELEEVRRERDGQQSQTEQLRRELNSLRAQLEETEWSLCQKSGEIPTYFVLQELACIYFVSLSTQYSIYNNIVSSATNMLLQNILTRLMENYYQVITEEMPS